MAKQKKSATPYCFYVLFTPMDRDGVGVTVNQVRVIGSWCSDNPSIAAARRFMLETDEHRRYTSMNLGDGLIQVVRGDTKKWYI